MSYKHILIAIDLSDTTNSLLEKGTKFSKLFKAKMSLLHVVHSIPVYGYGDNYVVDIESKLVKKATEEMEQLGNKFNIQTENIYVEIGAPKYTILQFTEENAVDLIVIGSHGRSGLLRVLGSCASGVIHGTHNDVFVIHYEEENLNPDTSN